MKHFILSAFAALLLGLCACSDDIKIETNDYGSTIENDNGTRVSTFVISNLLMNAPESLTEVNVILVSEDTGQRLSFTSSIAVESGRAKCRMTIPKGESIPDGNYTLSLERPDGSVLGSRLSVRFVKEMLHTVSAETVVYMGLSGEGTEDDPYIIASTADFESLVSNLRRDSLQLGRGRFFKQTASFNAPTQSKMIDGRSYYCYSFAGNYDGGGHSITSLYYIGADLSEREPEKDSSIGLFSTLEDGATVKNLNISDASIVNGYDNIGFLAGQSSGNIYIENVQASGSVINAHDNCGALIGYHSHGTLSIKRHDIGVNITGNDCIGGVVGRADQASMIIENISTASRQFSIKGGKNVGGLAGMVDGSIRAKDISLTHTVSSEDSKVKIVSGTDNIGGLIGSATFNQGENSFDNITIKCPVGGNNYTGGMFGKIDTSVPTTLTKCVYSSIVTGSNYTGGLAGSISCGSEYLRFTGNDNESRIVVTMADAEVNGGSYTGGLAGAIYGTIRFDAKVEIAVNVTATGDNAGGVAGMLKNGNLRAERISMTSNTMNVKGYNYVGGIVGYAESGDVTGADKFDYTGNWIIPDISTRHSLFSGNVTGNSNVGGIVGKIKYGNVRAVHSTATVTASSTAGGVVGLADAGTLSGYIIEDSSFDGTVKVSDSTAGGIAGQTLSGMLAKDCVNYADISCADNVGGIIGFVDYGSAATNTDFCVNLGKISGKSNIGGIVGYMHGGGYYTRVYKSGNYGNISSEGRNPGGIVGNCDSKRIRIWHCANHGDVHTSCSDGSVGGIAGHLGEDPNGVHSSANLEIKECYNRGKVSASQSNVLIGGILGYQEEGGSKSSDHDSWVHDCVNEGPLPSDTKEDTGGIVGCLDHYSVVDRCYNRGKVSYGNAMVGTRKNSAIVTCNNLYALKDSGKGWHCNGFFNQYEKESSYYSFDFTNVWKMVDGYPRLRDCPFQDARP